MSDWRTKPTLTGRHMTLRPLSPDDRDALVVAASADGHQMMAGDRVRETVVYSILDREWPDVRHNLRSLLARYGESA